MKMNRFTLLMAAFPFVLYACGSDDSGGGGGTGGKKDAGTDSGKGGTGGTAATGGVGALGGTTGGGTGGTAGSGGGVAGAAGSGGVAGSAGSAGVAGAAGSGGVAGSAGAAGSGGTAGSSSGGTAGTSSGGTGGTPTGGTGGTDGGVSALGDTCGNPFVVGSLPFTVNGDTTGVGEDYGFTGTSCPPATSDKGQGSPDHVYAFTPTSTGKYIVKLDSVFDAALYAVTDCLNIDTTCVGGVDSALSNEEEKITIDAQAGTTYFVIVDGYETTPPGGAGTYTLKIEDAPPPPSNETCASAIAITSVPFQHSSDTTGTANDYGLTPGICSGISSSFTGAGTSDLVYAFTPTTSGTYVVSVATTSFDAMLYVSTSCAATLTSCVAGSETSGSSGTESVLLTATAGTTYYLFVDGYNSSPSPGNAGEYTLTVSLPPANDTCASAKQISAVPYSDAGSTAGAAADYGFSSGACPPASSLNSGSSDVVYSFTPALTGSYTITLDSQYDSALYIATNCADIDNSCVGGVDDCVTTCAEEITTNLTAGTQYFIIVDGYYSTSNLAGSFQLDVVKNP